MVSGLSEMNSDVLNELLACLGVVVVVVVREKVKGRVGAVRAGFRSFYARTFPRD